MIRKEDQGFIEWIREVKQRLHKLESSQNNAVRRTDIRLSDLVVTGDDVNMKLCLENLNTKQSVCIGEGENAEIIWSWGGALTGDTTISQRWLAPFNILITDVILSFGVAGTGAVNMRLLVNDVIVHTFSIAAAQTVARTAYTLKVLKDSVITIQSDGTFDATGKNFAMTVRYVRA